MLATQTRIVKAAITMMQRPFRIFDKFPSVSVSKQAASNCRSQNLFAFYGNANLPIYGFLLIFNLERHRLPSSSFSKTQSLSFFNYPFHSRFSKCRINYHFHRRVRPNIQENVYTLNVYTIN